MKKLFTLILIFVFMTSAALADETPLRIIGSWYYYYSKGNSPELSSIYKENDHVIYVITCCEDGTILLTESDIKDKQITPYCSPAGKWEKGDEWYNVSIIGFGEGEAKVIGDYLYIQIASISDDVKGYIRFHRLIPLDPYSDYIYR